MILNQLLKKNPPQKKPLRSFEIADDFKIELIASEPLIGDPVDMEIDEYGRLYVVEMPGYPLDKSGSGKIKLLADTDGDGKMDKSTTFAENLILPNSVMRWKKGSACNRRARMFYILRTPMTMASLTFAIRCSRDLHYPILSTI